MFLTATDQAKPQTALWRLLTLIVTLIGIAGSVAGTASAATATTAHSSSGRTAPVGLETRVGVTTHFSGGSSARISTVSPACVGENVTGYDGTTVVSCVATKPGTVPGQGSFKPGQLYETTIKTPNGNVQVIAEVEVQGGQLVLKDIAIYGENGALVNQVGAGEFVALKNQVAKQAAAEGFETVRITGERVAGSSASAAKKGQPIDITFKAK